MKPQKIFLPAQIYFLPFSGQSNSNFQTDDGEEMGNFWGILKNQTIENQYFMPKSKIIDLVGNFPVSCATSIRIIRKISTNLRLRQPRRIQSMGKKWGIFGEF